MEMMRAQLYASFAVYSLEGTERFTMIITLILTELQIESCLISLRSDKAAVLACLAWKGLKMFAVRADVIITDAG